MLRWFRHSKHHLSALFRSRPKKSHHERVPLAVEQLEGRFTPSISGIVPPGFTAPAQFAAGNTPDSIAALTLDNGSKVLLVANFYGNSVSVLKADNRGNLTPLETLATGNGPNGFAVGDFGNGHQDFAIANYSSGTVSVFLGDGTGNFTLHGTLSSGSGASSGPANEMAAADFNGDGKLDLAVANQNDGTVSVFLGQGGGNFGPAANYAAGPGSDAVIATDLYGRGRPDLAVANYNNGTVSLLANDGTGHFSSPTTVSVGDNPFYIAAGDFNEDGRPDLVTANLGAGTVSILTNQGKGSFSRSDVGVGSNPGSIAVGDLNGDGNLDLAVGNYGTNDVSELLGNGDGTFQAAVSISAGPGTGPNGVVLADLNNDGNLDVATANQNTGSASVLLNTAVLGLQGQPLQNVILARFTDTTAQPIASYSASINWADGNANDPGTIVDLGGGDFAVYGPPHTFANAGTYDVQVTVSGAGENTLTIPVTATIRSAGVITGSIFNDRNGNGQQDPGDTGLGLWNVQLYDSTGQLIGTTQSAADGSFQFAGLLPGTYLVQQVLPTGWTQTARSNDMLVVPAGGAASTTFGDFQNINISGTVFSDLQGGKTQDAGDPGLAGWTVQLYSYAGGQLSATPLQTTTTDVLGGYHFSNLGPLATGTSYVVAEALPSGWVQDGPASNTADSILLPNGETGYLVPATGGVSLTDAAGNNDLIGGTGTVTLQALTTSSVTGTLAYNDGAGNARSVDAYFSQFKVGVTDGSGTSTTVDTFCFDPSHDVAVGQTTAVYIRGDLPSSRAADIFARHGQQDLSNNPIQAAAVQIALWDLALGNHDPTSFSLDADGTYSSGDESVFSIAFDNSANAAPVAALVNQYLQESIGSTLQGGWFDASAAGNDLNRGQCLLLPTRLYNFSNVQLAITNLDVSYGTGKTVTLSGTVTDPHPAGVTVTFSGPVTGSAVTDSSGSFSLTTTAASLGTVTAVATDSFSLVSAPAQVAITATAPQIQNLAVTYGTGTTVTLTGTVVDTQPGGLPVSFTGVVTGTATTNADGTFSFTAQASGLGSVSATTTNIWGLTSNPASVTLTANPPQIGPLSATYGQGRTVTITGTVSDAQPGGLTVSFTGVANGAVITNADGSFSFTTQASGFGTVTATTMNVWGLSSNAAQIALAPTPPQIANFTATEIALNIWTFAGTVTAGQSVNGMTVVFGGLPSLQGMSATVAADGTFSFTTNLKPGERGTATAQTTDAWSQQSNLAQFFVDPTP